MEAERKALEAAHPEGAREDRLGAREDAEGTQHGEVDRDQRVQILLLHELDDPVQAKEHARADDWEAHGIFLGDRFHLRRSGRR